MAREEIPRALTTRVQTRIKRGRWGSCLLVLVLSFALATAVTAALPVSGRAIDSETLRPLPMVAIILTSMDDPGSGKVSTLTDEAGHFTIPEVPQGTYRLLASAVGFGLIKQTLRIEGAEEIELELLLTPGTALKTSVTVQAAPEKSWATLSSTELDKLKNVLMDDPFRALQQLPAVVSNDDFNTGFAVQGSGFDRVGIMIDGIPAYGFSHTIEGVEDTGSTSLLSADLVDGMDLFSGGSSSRWGGSSAGYLEMTTRSGNSSSMRNLLSVSGSALLFLSEGPIGTGSWLFSGRKSYIDWIVRKIDQESDLNFGFYDLFGKVEQTVGKKHWFAASFIHGKTGLEDAEEGSSINGIDRGAFTSNLAHLEWRWLANDTVSSATHFYFQRQSGQNRNQYGELLWDDLESVWGLRNVWDWQVTPSLTVSAGATIEWWDVANQRNLFNYASGEWYRLAGFDEVTNRQHAFTELRWAVHPDLKINGGWTWSRQGVHGKTYQSPSIGVEWRTSGKSRLTASWGGSGQFPFFNQLLGLFGNDQLDPEDARNTQARWRYQVSPELFFEAGGYFRTRENVPWRRNAFWRLVDDQITPPSTAPYENVLKDRSYGGEIRIGKASQLGLGGWIGYAWGRSRWSESPGEWFPGTYDQPNGVGIFLHYRWSSQVELSLKYKGASGLPLPAYAAVGEGGRYYLTEKRNQTRLPEYHRLDFRLAKAFTKDRYRISLFVEVLNLTGRRNERFAGHEIDSVNIHTGRIYGLTQKLLPFVPTAGLAVEF